MRGWGLRPQRAQIPVVYTIAALTTVPTDLCDFYDMANKRKKEFEVVFVSSDEDEEKRSAYMAKSHGPWLSLRHTGSDDDLRGELKRKYGACAGSEQQAVGVANRKEGIPCLAIVKPNGTLVTLSGCDEMKAKGPAALKTWKKGINAPTKEAKADDCCADGGKGGGG